MGRKLKKVSYDLAKFCNHRHCGSGNIVVLVCHLILKDHVAKELSNSTDGSQSR